MSSSYFIKKSKWSSKIPFPKKVIISPKFEFFPLYNFWAASSEWICKWVKVSSVSSKSLHIGGIKKTFTKPQNWLSVFILLYIVVLFIVLIISCLVRRFKYICSRHSQGGITIDFAFQLCNYSFKWNQKLKKIFGYWVLLKFDLENHQHNTKVLSI